MQLQLQVAAGCVELAFLVHRAARHVHRLLHLWARVMDFQFLRRKHLVERDVEAARRLIDDMQSDRIRIVLDPANLFEQADLLSLKLIVRLK